jgi:(hydroxyamino)benzene mutase
LMLFFLGLLVGFAVPAFKNPRMGLSGHLVGVINGVFLIAVALIWNEVKLSARAGAAVFWTLLYGSYANIVASVIAAAYGTKAFTPIVGEGFGAGFWPEGVVSFLLVTVGLAMVGALASLLWGVRKA